jgi:hypothetical protein
VFEKKLWLFLGEVIMFEDCYAASEAPSALRSSADVYKLAYEVSQPSGSGPIREVYDKVKWILG